MKISLGNGLREVEIELPREKLVGILVPREIDGVENTRTEIKRALRNPIGSKKLKDIVN